MKVYVVIEESAIEDMFDLNVWVFEKKEDAEKSWETLKKSWLEGTNWEHESDGIAHSFEMWRDGEYSSNHVCLYLEEKEVE